MKPQDEPLAMLPAHDATAEVSARIRSEAHALLARRRRGQSRADAGGLLGVYQRVVEPAALLALGLVQLAWTVRDAVALLR